MGVAADAVSLFRLLLSSPSWAPVASSLVENTLVDAAALLAGRVSEVSDRDVKLVMDLPRPPEDHDVDTKQLSGTRMFP